MGFWSHLQNFVILSQKAHICLSWLTSVNSCFLESAVYNAFKLIILVNLHIHRLHIKMFDLLSIISQLPLLLHSNIVCPINKNREIKQQIPGVRHICCICHYTVKTPNYYRAKTPCRNDRH